MADKKITRKGSPAISVWVTPDEKNRIENFGFADGNLLDFSQIIVTHVGDVAGQPLRDQGDQVELRVVRRARRAGGGAEVVGVDDKPAGGFFQFRAHDNPARAHRLPTTFSAEKNSWAISRAARQLPA